MFKKYDKNKIKLIKDNYYSIVLKSEYNLYLLVYQMQNTKQIGEIVIIGGGPVGNFSSVMASMLGVKCTVYQKRDSYTRQINLKIQKDFFQHVSKTICRVSRRQIQFFDKLNNTINKNNGKILLKDLESSLKQQAENLGAHYIQKQIKTFQQVEYLHKQTNPVILDCTGRNSFLRVSQFGEDDKNMQIFNLHHALHINFKSSIPKNFDFKLIYPVIKNNQNLKLGSIVVSKKKHVNQDPKYSHVTIPLFITDDLSELIDQKYPKINRNPLIPFSIKQGQSEIVKQVQQVIYSLFCALVMQNWDIQWETVVLKKINITCGYSIKRSQNRYISLGDSAAHFAYFKSLNFGLKHAFEFIKILSSYHSLKYNLGPFDQKAIVNRCWKKYPLLWPTYARQGSSASEYFVTNQQLKILAPYIYDIRYDTMKRLDLMPHISQQKIKQRFQNYQRQYRQKNWQQYLTNFQQIRQKDIDNQILSNRSKKAGSELVSYFIWMNSLSPVKLSETISFLTNGYYLTKKDFDYFGETINLILSSLPDKNKFAAIIQQKTKQILQEKKGQIPRQYQQFFKQINIICHSENFKYRQFCKIVNTYEMNSKINKHKQIILLFKILQIAVHLIEKQTQQKNKKRQEKILQH